MSECCVVCLNEDRSKPIPEEGSEHFTSRRIPCVTQFPLSDGENTDEKPIIVPNDISESVKYFLPSEVAIHNTPTDCWISYNDLVYDITDVCKDWAGKKEIEPILAYAGKDISHWFDHEKNDIRYHVHPITGVRVPYCPHGPIPDVNCYEVPASTWRPLEKCPWWLNEKYRKGYLTKNARPCRIMNVLTGTQVVIMVCEEDSIKRIRERALIYNANGLFYEWKFEGKDLDLDLTLTQNGIPDERDRFVDCGLRDDYFIPCLMSYYKDELFPFKERKEKEA